MQRLEKIIEEINDSERPSSELLVKLQEFRPEDIAETFDDFKRGLRKDVFQTFGDEFAAEVLVELDDILAIEILKDLAPERVASILNCLPPDEGADMIALSEEEDQPEILHHVEDDLAEQIRDLVTYAPESAGGLMTSEFISVTGDELVRSVLLKVRTSEGAETINFIYITNGDGRLVGVISVRDLLQAGLNEPISSIMEKDVISVPLDMDQEEVSRTANKYHFSTLPVVDEEGSLKGIVTFDDLMEVIEEESSEDIYRMAGDLTLHPTYQPVWRRILARFPWLMVTLGGTIVAAALIKVFEAVFLQEGGLSHFTSLWDLLDQAFSEIQNKFTFLMCFVPMIGGMAGNVGLQSSTVMVRGFATGEVESDDFFPILWKEILIAVVIGALSGLIVGGVVSITYEENAFYGFVIGLSLLAAIFSAAILGTLTPFVCLGIKVDPAYASGPLLTTLNDIIGFLIFFGIAYALL
jgi:magnesium transporter